MNVEQLNEKKNQSTHDCDTCEFKVVPVRIEPCKSCSETVNNWKASKIPRGISK